jgi:hypothetical protein
MPFLSQSSCLQTRRSSSEQDETPLRYSDCQVAFYNMSINSNRQRFVVRKGEVRSSGDYAHPQIDYRIGSAGAAGVPGTK